jgi:ABC-2 type transport system ATP-binding protein
MQINVEGLVKEYKRKENPETLSKAFVSMFQPKYEIVRAVDNISFSIKKGEKVGYIGPNGSGKSTTIKMLSGVLMPTSGEIRITGLNPSQNRIKINKKTGVVFGNRSVLWWDVPIIESYRVLQKLYEIPEKTFLYNLDKFSEIMGIQSLLGVPERQLSLGQKMRCNIVAAFLHNPEIVYLDEPTIGLDSESKLRIRKFINELNDENKTTFLVTSHDFQDIESLCNRIILINHGKKVIDEKINLVKQKFEQKKQLRFEIDRNPWIIKDNFEMSGAKLIHQTENTLVIECEINKTNTMSVVETISRQCTIKDVLINGQDIESIIQEVVNADNKVK